MSAPAPDQPSLLHEAGAEPVDLASSATAAAVGALVASGAPSESIVVPGKAQQAGSKSAFVIPSGAVVKSLRGHRRGVTATSNKHGQLVYGRAIVTDQNRKLAKWQEVVRANVMEQRTGALLEGALAIVVRFEEVRPKSHYRSGRSTSHLLASGAPQRRTKMPDATKLLRAFEDALTGVVWADDSQIVWQLNEKVYGREDVATITVVELGPA